MIYVGIDNGISGALVALSDHPGPPVLMTPMPTRGKAKGNEVDALEVRKWIWSLETPVERLVAVLETPGKFSRGVQAVSSMWDSYGCLRAILETMGVRHHRIPPQAWQKVMLPGCAKGDTKPAALLKARQLWPSESFLATARSSKPHEGLIDAALIGEYARIRNL